MSRARDEDMDGVEVPLELRGAFENPIELARLRRNAFESVGRPYADGILYGGGLPRGLLDGLRVARRCGAALGGAARQAQPFAVGPRAARERLEEIHHGGGGERVQGRAQDSANWPCLKMNPVLLSCPAKSIRHNAKPSTWPAAR